MVAYQLHRGKMTQTALCETAERKINKQNLENVLTALPDQEANQLQIMFTYIFPP